MNDIYLFIWGTLVFLFAVGPLTAAGYLDLRARRHAKEIEEAAGLLQEYNHE